MVLAKSVKGALKRENWGFCLEVTHTGETKSLANQKLSIVN